MNRIRELLIAAVSSWWVIGAVGWTIVITNYPIETILPAYAE